MKSLLPELPFHQLSPMGKREREREREMRMDLSPPNNRSAQCIDRSPDRRDRWPRTAGRLWRWWALVLSTCSPEGAGTEQASQGTQSDRYPQLKELCKASLEKEMKQTQMSRAQPHQHMPTSFTFPSPSFPLFISLSNLSRTQSLKNYIFFFFVSRPQLPQIFLWRNRKKHKSSPEDFFLNTQPIPQLS